MVRKKQEADRECITSFIDRITAIHGTKHFTLKSGRGLLFWTIAFFSNVVLTILFIMTVKDKFYQGQIVTEINANCKVNQVPFPAVSICNINMVSLKESENIARVLKHYNITEDYIHAFFNAFPELKRYGKNSKKHGDMSIIMSILKHHFFTVDTILEEVHQKCENLLRYCAFNRKKKNCDEIFVLIKTSEGHCCTFNYAALNDASEVGILPPDPDMEYYDDQNGEDGDETLSGIIITTSESGSISGLNVVFNVEPEDYPSWSPVRYYGVKVLISDPNDYPETTVLYRYITLGESVEIKVEPLIFQSETDVRRIDAERRACWFHDEVQLGHTNRYSYETCCTECRMKTYLEDCKCVPYKYPREKSSRICEFEDLVCLNNVTVYKSEKEMKCNPVCFMECRDKKYSLTSDLTPFSAEKYPEDAIQGANISELAALQVYFGKSTCNCYRLKQFIDATYLIATYGGVFSLSFGGSVISLMEIIYLLFSIILTGILTAIKKSLFKKKTKPI